MEFWYFVREQIQSQSHPLFLSRPGLELEILEFCLGAKPTPIPSPFPSQALFRAGIFVRAKPTQIPSPFSSQAWFRAGIFAGATQSFAPALNKEQNLREEFRALQSSALYWKIQEQRIRISTLRVLQDKGLPGAFFPIILGDLNAFFWLQRFCCSVQSCKSRQKWFQLHQQPG